MRAEVTKPFHGAPDGQVHGRDFVKGDIVDGDLAAVAVREKWAKEIKDPEHKAQPAAGETKAQGNAPENQAQGNAAENKSQ